MNSIAGQGLEFIMLDFDLVFYLFSRQQICSVHLRSATVQAKDSDEVGANCSLQEETLWDGKTVNHHTVYRTRFLPIG
jgi:hypothetical protein